MNWYYKFAFDRVAFDEIEEMMENRPWLLVDDDFTSADNDTFIGVQTQLMLARGWDWFTKVIRGRVYPKLRLTTITALNQERNPNQGDVDPESVAKVQQKFPDVSVVSLVGVPHVVSGPPIEQDVLSRIGSQAQRWSRGLNKMSRKFADDTESDFPYFKDEFQFEIADVDRYATDKYLANLTLQETDKIYSIGFQMYNYQVGITGAVQYWHYDKNEFVEAKRTFKELKKVLAKTMSKIEFHRPPMAVITPMIRAAFQPIDLRHKERSGNYFYNWFEELPKEPDWRTTLYGNRYPLPVIQTIETFWRADDGSKEITVEGTSRSRVLRYKPSYGMIPKYAANQDRLKQLWSDAWERAGNFAAGAAAGAGAGSVLLWLMGLMPPLQIQQQLENGASPDEIITQVTPEAPAGFNADQISPGVDLGNLGNFDGLDPTFSSKVKQILVQLTEKGWKPRVASGLRTVEQQQEKINQGRSSLNDPRSSKHVQGLAADIIDSRYGWNGPAADLNFQFWNDLGEAARAAGLAWGGDWKSFKDVAHIEAIPIDKSSVNWNHAYKKCQTG